MNIKWYSNNKYYNFINIDNYTNKVNNNTKNNYEDNKKNIHKNSHKIINNNNKNDTL